MRVGDFAGTMHSFAHACPPSPYSGERGERAAKLPCTPDARLYTMFEPLGYARGSFLFVDVNQRCGPPVSGSNGKVGATVPKMKTHKASKKRFRVTATGLLKRSQAGKKHLNSHKTGKRKRHLRAEVVSGNKFARKYIKAMGGDA